MSCLSSTKYPVQFLKNFKKPKKKMQKLIKLQKNTKNIQKSQKKFKKPEKISKNQINSNVRKINPKNLKKQKKSKNSQKFQKMLGKNLVVVTYVAYISFSTPAFAYQTYPVNLVPYHPFLNKCLVLSACFLAFVVFFFFPLNKTV